MLQESAQFSKKSTPGCHGSREDSWLLRIWKQRTGDGVEDTNQIVFGNAESDLRTDIDVGTK